MPASVKCWFEVSVEQFHNDIVPLGEPAVLKGFFNSWPVVEQANTSAEQLCDYLSGFDTGQLVDTLLLHPETGGRIFYQPNFSGFNYERRQYPISAILTQLLQTRADENAVRLAAQSALIAQCLPGFGQHHPNSLLGEDVQPRIWIGNRVTVPAHFDDADNLACVVSGSRRFTLFPPEQIGNMYIGPLDYAPTGAPISLVDFTHPDLDTYPKAAKALEQAQVAELQAGDALYIPALWWHQVESLGDINILCNYWWNGSVASTGKTLSPFDSLLHGLLTIKHLPPHRKKAWQAFFEHYIFATVDDPVGHIPTEKRGILGQVTANQESNLKRWLARQLAESDPASSPKQ